MVYRINVTETSARINIVSTSAVLLATALFCTRMQQTMRPSDSVGMNRTTEWSEISGENIGIIYSEPNVPQSDSITDSARALLFREED